MAAPAFSNEDLLEFLQCARYGELEDVAAFLTDGAPVDFADEGGNTALHKAAANGHVDVAKLLVEHKASFTANKSGNTPLHWAALNGQKPMAEYLLAAFEDVDVLAKNSFNKSALTEALLAGHEEIARSILAHKSVDTSMAADAPSAAEAAGEGIDEDEEDEDDDIFDEEGGSGEGAAEEVDGTAAPTGSAPSAEGSAGDAK